MRNLLALLVFVATPALAVEPLNWGERQQGSVSGMAMWSPGIGVAGSHEFEPRFGFIGFSGEVMYHIHPMISVGATSGYQLLYGKKRDTLEFDNAALNATQFRYLDLAPVLAVGRFYLPLDGLVTPFAGLGIGTIYANRIVDVGLVAIGQDGWHFGLSPQIGAIAHTDGPDVVLDVEFAWAVKSGDLPAESWVTFEVGLLFD